MVGTLLIRGEKVFEVSGGHAVRALPREESPGSLRLLGQNAPCAICEGGLSAVDVQALFQKTGEKPFLCSSHHILTWGTRP